MNQQHSYVDKKGICSRCGAKILEAPSHQQCFDWIACYPWNEDLHPCICINCFEADPLVRYIKKITALSKIQKPEKTGDNQKKHSYNCREPYND